MTLKLAMRKNLIPLLIYIIIPAKYIRWKLLKILNIELPEIIVKRRIKKRFIRHMGYSPNLKNPSTFNEKLQWLKLYYRHPSMPQSADKYGVRGILESHGLANYLTKLYGVYEKPDDIQFDLLPDRFVIKTNHDSGSVFIIKDKKLENIKLLKKKLSKSLARPFEQGIRSGEWHYMHINPKIIIEELLEDKDGNLHDYKVHCFNGKAKYIQVDFDRFTNHTRNFYSIDWQKMPFSNKYQKNNNHLEAPYQLAQMIKIAGTLAQPYPYVRIDFYCPDTRIYFGEITFFHESGLEPFLPDKWEKELGNEINCNSSDINIDYGGGKIPE